MNSALEMADAGTASHSDQRDLPILYSFRRCPYAMRARLSLSSSGEKYLLREIVLRDKPAEMIAASPKATVPVLHLQTGEVIDQSLDIMRWTLARNDPEGWLSPNGGTLAEMEALIEECESAFKPQLDRYKYATRYGEDTDPLFHREQACLYLNKLNARLENSAHLFGDEARLADFAIFPFVRQFANTDRAWFDAQTFKPLQEWLSNHLNSERFQKIMTKWPVWKPGDEEPLLPDTLAH